MTRCKLRNVAVRIPGRVEPFVVVVCDTHGADLQRFMDHHMRGETFRRRSAECDLSKEART